MQATIGQSNDAPESSSKESEDHQAEMKATADESAATLQQLVNDQKKDQDGDWTPDPNQTKEQRERGLQWTSPKVGPRRRQA
ncbi:MAG: hypothetical protein FJ278_00410 [Planctomycetes bacterium]|nr:hypothetical protein [Planctomycetota bacterium]